MAGTINNLYKTELIRQRGPWRTFEQVELATLEWVWWWNQPAPQRRARHAHPAEVESDYYAGLDTPLGTPVSQTAR